MTHPLYMSEADVMLRKLLPENCVYALVVLNTDAYVMSLCSNVDDEETARRLLMMAALSDADGVEVVPHV